MPPSSLTSALSTRHSSSKNKSIAQAKCSSISLIAHRTSQHLNHCHRLYMSFQSLSWVCCLSSVLHILATSIRLVAFCLAYLSCISVTIFIFIFLIPILFLLFLFLIFFFFIIMIILYYVLFDTYLSASQCRSIKFRL